MKRWITAVLACLVAGCMGLMLAGCSSQSYTPPAKQQTVSTAALGKAGTLRVGVNASSAPLAGQTANSVRIVGIDVDIAAYLADQLGVKVEVIDVGTDPAGALSSNKVDVVLGVENSDTTASYWRSAAYIESGVALFGKSTETAVPAVDSKPTIAAQVSSKSSWRVSNLFGEKSLAVQADLKSAFDALSKGTVRYVAADGIIGTYVAHTGDVDAKVVAMLQDPSGYCAAISQSNAELQGAITTALDKLKNGGMLDIIETKWLGAPMALSSVPVVKAAPAPAAQPAATQADDQQDEGEGEGEGDEGEEGDAEGEGEAY
ncbi:MAG: transporter substrate-binding domain-containing protein [Eggerthellaceae bacterium]|nr:transporter substrate-binding domain-containing protein [Eggerthellaceae bacterium]